MDFTARANRLEIAENTIIRATPERGRSGPPPIMDAGSTFPIKTQFGTLVALVLESAPGRLVFRVDGGAWVATPITPVEAPGFDVYEQGSGVTDWVVRGCA